VPEVADQALRLVWSGLALAVAVCTDVHRQPKTLFYNPAFEVKMVLLLAAILVQALFVPQSRHSEHPNPGWPGPAWHSLSVSGSPSAWRPRHRLRLTPDEGDPARVTRAEPRWRRRLVLSGVRQQGELAFQFHAV